MQSDVLMKITLSSLQTIGIVLSFAFKWDEDALGLMGLADDVSSLGTAYINIQCLSRRDDYVLLGLLVGFSFPMLAGILGASILVLFQLCKAKHSGQELNLCNAWLANRTDMIAVVMFVTFYVYPDLADKALLGFACVQLGPTEDDRYLLQDLSIRCFDDSRHTAILVLGVLPLMILYVIGVPFFVIQLIKRNPRQVKVVANLMLSHLNDHPDLPVRESNETLDKVFEKESLTSSTPARFSTKVYPSALATSSSIADQEFRRRYGFLLLGYRPDYPWWESVTLLRKVLLSVIAVSFWEDKRTQIELGVLVQQCALILQISFQPYATTLLNRYICFSRFMCAQTLTVCPYMLGLNSFR